jgi:hypothetical protein
MAVADYSARPAEELAGGGKMKVAANGRETEVTGLPLSHEIIVRLCHPIWAKTRSFREDGRPWTVTWRHGDQAGCLAPGESIAPLEGMVFRAEHVREA